MVAHCRKKEKSATGFLARFFAVTAAEPPGSGGQGQPFRSAAVFLALNICCYHKTFQLTQYLFFHRKDKI
jgi:hypothetical protein